MFPSHALIIMISPLTSADRSLFQRLRAYGYQALLVSPDPIDFADPILAQDINNRLAIRAARIERRLLLNRYCPTANPGHRLAGQPTFVSTGAECPDPLAWAAGIVRSNDSRMSLRKTFFFVCLVVISTLSGCRVCSHRAMVGSRGGHHQRDRLAACPKIS